MTASCCEAVLAALPERCELIVVDDASEDGTTQVLRQRFPAVRVLRRELNGGFARAVNDGIAVSSGEILLLLNSDALVEPDALQKLIELLRRRPDIGIAGALLLNEDGSRQWSGGRDPSLLWLTVLAGGAAALIPRGFRATAKELALVEEVDWVSGAAMAIRREVWNRIGPFREEFRFYAQDLDLCRRTREAGWRVVLTTEVRVRHLRGATVAAKSPLDHVPSLLWPDLIEWMRSVHGTRYAWWSSFFMESAARVRVLLRAIRAMTRSRARRAADAEVSTAIAHGCRALSRQRRVMSDS